MIFNDNGWQHALIFLVFLATSVSISILSAVVGFQLRDEQL